MDMPQLKSATAALADQAFRPSTSANHVCKADAFITFCNHYNCNFINLSYYITYLRSIFTSSKRIRNYASGVRFLHKQLNLAPKSHDSLPCVIPSESYRPDHENTTYLIPPHPPTPSYPVVLAVNKPGIPGTTMKVCLTCGVSGDAQEEQPHSPLC